MKQISRTGMLFSALATLFILIFSYFTQSVGGYAIELFNPVEGNKMMMLSESSDFFKPTTTLYPEPLTGAMPIGIRGKLEAEPLEISGIETFRDGSNNGLNYFAYTFYTKNIGKDNLDYNVKLYLTDVKNNVDKAIRIKVIIEKDYFGEKIIEENVYAQIQGPNGVNPGAPEPGTIPFHNASIALNQNRFNFKTEMVDRYTVIMWIHGEDADCTDEIIKGKLSLTMRFNVLA